MYNLGQDGLGMNRVAAMSQQTIQHQASLIVKTIASTHFSTITHIAVVDKSESVNLQLLAVTESGKIFFSYIKIVFKKIVFLA